jgi:hypothetical protein
MALVTPHNWEAGTSEPGYKDIPITHEIGPTNLVAIRSTELNRVTQVRKTYPRDEIDQLKRSLRLTSAQNSDAIELFHQLTVLEVDDAQCARYLSRLNRLWGSDHQPDQLTPNERGNFYILVSGHCRDIAIGEIIEEEGWDPRSVAVKASVRHDISLFMAVLMQQAENVHNKPPAHEEAASITLLYELGKEEGEIDCLADYIKASPFKEDKIRDAFRYQELPTIVHEMVETKSLAYSRALLYVPLIRAYRQYTAEPEELIEARLERYILDGIDSRYGPDTISAKIQGQILVIIQQYTKEATGEQQLFSDAGWEAQLEAERAQSRRLRFGLAIRPLRDLGMLARLETQAARGERTRPILTHPEMREHLANLRRALEELAAASGVEVAHEADLTIQIVQQMELASSLVTEQEVARRIGALSVVPAVED